jgi:hypothetical protein
VLLCQPEGGLFFIGTASGIYADRRRGMVDMMRIMILASGCSRMDAYLELIDETARDLGLNYSLEKVTDSNRMNEYHLIVRCIFYCPGCHVLSYGWPKSSKMYAPALVINGHLKLHSCIPSRGLLREILAEYI